LCGKAEEKRQHGRPRRRLKNNIKMYHAEIVLEDVAWVQLARDRV
jgi:hypothetical protein